MTASQPADRRQIACRDRLQKVQQAGGACAVHSLAEVFAVLTRLPMPHRVPPEAALKIAEHTATRFEPVALTAVEHLAALRNFVSLGLTGAMVYDALIIACARKVDAEHIYTLDQRHFGRIAPDLAPRILEP